MSLSAALTLSAGLAGGAWFYAIPDNPAAFYPDDRAYQHPYHYRHEIKRHALYLARRNQPALILGTSRVTSGFSDLRGYSEFFPAGVSGTTLEDAFELLKFAHRFSGTREAWFGINFGSFYFPMLPRRDENQWLQMSSRHGWAGRIGFLVSFAHAAAVAALLDGLERIIPAKIPMDLRESLYEENLAKNLARALEPEGLDQLERRLLTARKIVLWSRENGVRLKFFFHPANIIEPEFRRLAGFYGEEESLKRQLCEIACGDGEDDLELWDFSDYPYRVAAAAVREGMLVPTAGFYDATHYEPALGRQIFETMRGLREPPSWGARLTMSTLESHFKSGRSARKRFSNDFPVFIGKTREKVRKTYLAADSGM